MAWYKVGTISVTNNSQTVTGSGTAWILNAQVGEALYAPDGRLYEITNIASDTSMTIAPAYLGTTQSAQAYVIVPSQSYIRDLAAQAADLVNQYSTIANTIGAGKFPDGTLANPAFKFADDLDTGFFRSAANEVTFVAGGVAQFKYNASGVSFTTGGALVGTTATQTLTNKTLTAPVINSPTGLVKADVGLGNVDNTSDATKNSATATLTNKTLNLTSNTLIATSAQLRTAVTDETGTGVLVFNESPTLTTPTITGGTVNPTTLTENSVAAVVQSDIGTAPNEIPLNQYLGNLAFQSSESAIIESGRIDLKGGGSNLVVRSQEFDNNASWVKNGVTVLANTTVAPDGETTAETLTATASTGQHRIDQVTSSIVGSQRTWSCFIKAGTHNFVQLMFGTDATAFANFDITSGAGAVGTIGASATASISDAGNGWYRCVITSNSLTASAQVYILQITSATAARFESWTALGTETVFLWGAQLERSSSVGNYIATTASVIAFENAYGATALSVIPTTGFDITYPMAFELVSDTSLVIKVKGSDGTIRSTTLTLA